MKILCLLSLLSLKENLDSLPFVVVDFVSCDCESRAVKFGRLFELTRQVKSNNPTCHSC